LQIPDLEFGSGYLILDWKPSMLKFGQEMPLLMYFEIGAEFKKFTPYLNNSSGFDFFY